MALHGHALPEKLTLVYFPGNVHGLVEANGIGFPHQSSLQPTKTHSPGVVLCEGQWMGTWPDQCFDSCGD